ncbi:MAG: hypothetical protein ABIL09_10240 [Gemmatimonadota bacterium]
MADTPCRNLRTKKNYVPACAGADRGGKPDLDHYFCLRTLHAIGADDGPVGPRVCAASRHCFEALVSAAGAR